MKSEEIIDAELVPDEAAIEQPKPSVPWAEQILSPQSLQWMMLSGGGLLMTGFVIWLWSVGVFENPLIVAGVVGSATLGTLAAGVSLVRYSRYQLAGRGLALLGSLALPLNLWLYDAQGLATLADGGHLWVPAALCCAIYAAVARVLRDSNFVYALVGGVVATGMLLLADESVGRLWTLMPPVTFLVSIGWMSMFADRLFADDDGDFTRGKFGLAFHRAGLAVVVSGLALLLGGHLFQLADIWGVLVGRSADQFILTAPQQVVSLALILASAVGFAVQANVQKFSKYYIAAALLGAWAIPVTLRIFAIEISMAQIAIVTAGLVTLGNAFVARLRKRSDAVETKFTLAIESMVNEGSLVAISALTVLAGGQIGVQVLGDPGLFFFSPIGWTATVQILLTAAAAVAVGWNLKEVDDAKSVRGSLGSILFGLGGFFLTASVWTAGFVVAGSIGGVFVLVTCLIPLAIALVGQVSQFGSERVAVAAKSIASVAMSTQLASVLVTDWGLFSITISTLHWSLCFAIASAVYFLTSRGRAIGIDRGLACLTATLSVVVAGTYFGFEFGYCLVLAPMLIGTALRVVAVVWQQQAKDQSTVLAANGLVLGSAVAGSLLALSRWLESDTGGTLFLMLTIQLACTVLASLLSKSQPWRMSFRAVIVATLGCMICVFDGWLLMDGWHRLEIGSLLAGVALLALGHVAWAREGDQSNGQRDETASLSLFVGSLLLSLPLGLGLLIYRLGMVVDPQWMHFHEVAAIGVGLVLFGSGMLCKLRSTTITGGALLGMFVFSLLALLRLPAQLQSVSVMLMVGGGVFFATALLMSVYRDRLISLPSRIREGEGVYRILRWR